MITVMDVRARTAVIAMRLHAAHQARSLTSVLTTYLALPARSHTELCCNALCCATLGSRTALALCWPHEILLIILPSSSASQLLQLTASVVVEPWSVVRTANPHPHSWTHLVIAVASLGAVCCAVPQPAV